MKPMRDSTRAIKGEVKMRRFVIPYRLYENEGDHIVCLNGVQQSMAMWQSFISRFSRQYRIVLFDFPNQGKAQILSGPPSVTLDEQVEILRQVLKTTRASNNLILIAASWGGVIAVAFASRYPHAVKRLMLASLGSKANKKLIETIKKGAEIDIENRREIADTLINSMGKDLPMSIRKKIVNQFCTMSAEKLRTFYEHGLAVISTNEISEVVKLENIKAQTTLVNGQNDTIIDLKDIKFLASQIPNCETKMIENVGHFLHLEREEVLDIYQEILSDNT
jgi:2-succinyl-6-hydroxy-2,4-cyclohexadiene-1-carboxylate synthase